MKKFLLLILIFCAPILSISQSDLNLYGYVKGLGMYYKANEPFPISETKSLEQIFLNQIHNRLNFRWYATNEFTLAVEARNRVFFGQMISDFPDYENVVNQDKGYFDLGTILGSGNGWFLHSMIDRAYLDYAKGDWQIRVGRQRINWGINLVWNPNDIFNTFDYFEFDYEERPGTDAVKIQYYTGVTSSAELVYKIARHDSLPAVAGMYRFSKSNYDFQVLGGWVGKDYVIGTGWAGDIKGGGFRGELSYFIPKTKDNGSTEAFVASVSGDYTTKKRTYLHGGILFNSHGKTGDAPRDGGFLGQDLSAKMLSPAKFNLFAQFSQPITPLLAFNVASMLNPSDGSSFIGPSATYSLGDNWELMVNGQLFLGKKGTEYGDFGKFVFGRIKWAF